MPELLTARLQLRPPRAEDFEGWARLMADPEAARFIGGVQPRAAAWRGFLTMVGAWQIQGFGMFSVIERASGQWLGRIGPWQPEGWPGTEVGWGLLSEWQGRGYAHEAAVASIDWAFDQLGWSEVIHTIDPTNTPSQRLAHALGSCLRGPGRLPPPFEAFPIEIWGQTRAQWRQRGRA
ncbi:MAG: GNAT family N-acetyltransferase [Lysobacterales bacterium]|jgi:RimJ/RimL family protein N-acetyltransferase